MRLIDADALYIDYLRPTTTTGVTCQGYVSQIQINNAPTIEPQRMRGKWMRTVLGSTNGYGTTVMYQCSECECMSISKYKYCPNCGEWMGGQDGNT